MMFAAAPARGYHARMTKGVLRWVLIIVAFWLLGPLVGRLSAGLRAPDGGSEVSMLLSESPGISAAVYLLAAVLATIAGYVGARAFSLRTGFFCAGLVMIWASWASGTIEGILRRTQSPSIFTTLVVEGVMLGLALTVMGILISRGARRAASEAPERSKAGVMLAALAAALAAGGFAAAAVARTQLPGQTIGAAIAAGIAGALIATVVDARVRLAPVIAVLSVLAVAGPASSMVMNGPTAVTDLYAGDLSPLARITPLHWVAGILLGVPIGSSWAAGLGRDPAPKPGADGKGP